ncbi:MAG: protein kinase [Ktedonobacteraceae bacterium]|nr:protein kinase [Ktedonobacteraceae bacterium]
MLESLPSGTILCGHYRIERALGSGGFGHVYLAIDTVTNQQYAVKEYLVTGPTGQEQLQHEAEVLGPLHHPNLAAYQDVCNEHGRYYIVLDYIEGNDLTDILRLARQRNEVVPIARILEWLLAICDAVCFLHSQHPPVIHRDIKPDNIRIRPDGTAILVDLGNAKTAADGARTLLFIRHQGTPGYAPEEQYPGGSGTDERSDVYALGGTLYFALTAQEPPTVSARKDAIQKRRNELLPLEEHLANNPPEQSQEPNRFRLGTSRLSKPSPRHSRHIAQLATLPPELLARLTAIIQRAMAMRSQDRYPSVADFADDLRMAASALPMAQTPSPDPHSTQPNLLYTYEAGQAANGTSVADIADTNTAPIPPAPMSSCPRCAAALVPNASYCPRCGASVAPQARAYISPSTTKAVDTTIRVSSQRNAPLQATLPRAATLSSSSSIPHFTAYNAAFNATKITSTPIAHDKFVHGPSASAKVKTVFPFSVAPLTLLFIAIIVVVLLVIVALLVLSHTHHGHDALDGILRNFFFSNLKLSLDFDVYII